MATATVTTRARRNRPERKATTAIRAERVRTGHRLRWGRHVAVVLAVRPVDAWSVELTVATPFGVEAAVTGARRTVTRLV